MADRVFALPHSYPDFPLQQRSPVSKSPRSPVSVRSPSDLAHEGKEVGRMRDRLPPPLRGLNQVRFRQFKKQIDNIRKLSYDLPKKEPMLRSMPNLTDKLRQIRGEKREAPEVLDSTEREGQVSVGSFPRTDLHKQLVGLIHILEGTIGSLNTNFQVVSGDHGDWKYAQGPCPLCKCTCRQTSPKSGNPHRDESQTTSISLEDFSYIQECTRCGNHVLTSSEEDGFICKSCKLGIPSKEATPGTVSLLLDFEVDELPLPLRSRTPTPPPIEKQLKSPNTGRVQHEIEKDRSPRKRLTISPKRLISIPRPSEEEKTVPSKLSLSLHGSSLRLIPGTHLLRLVLNKGWKEVLKQFPAEPKPPATPSFHTSAKVLFSGTGGSDSEVLLDSKTDQLNVSFSPNFLSTLQDSPAVPESDLPLLELAKNLHTEIEYVLSDHIQIAGKHQYVFEIRDVCESYIIQYLNLIRRLLKILMPYIPEAVSALEMCVKGLILVLENALGAVSEKIRVLETQAGVPRRSVETTDMREKLQDMKSELAEERDKSNKLEKSLKNVIRNYEEMIAIYHRDKGSELPVQVRSASAKQRQKPVNVSYDE